MLYNLLVWILWVVESVILSVVAVFFGLFDRSGRTSHLIARFWGKCFIYSSGIKVRIIGKENIIKDGPQIFISNHQGNFDIFSITAFFPVQLKWIAKKELFKIPFLGWAMKAARYVSIDRANKRSAIKSLLKATGLIERGFSVVIFPEGTRSEDGKLLPFKRGGMVLAKKTKAPVAPVTISGSYRIIRAKSIRIHRGEINIKIDKPIYTEDLTDTEKEELLPKVRGIIESNLREMTGGEYEGE